MPLPNITKHHAKQCSAQAKSSGCRCQNLAAFGMNVCRVHGARKATTIKRGIDHPNYQHGRETRQGRINRVKAMKRLRFLEEIGHIFGFIEGKRIPGRNNKSAK
jgi:hypothetical protein